MSEQFTEFDLFSPDPNKPVAGGPPSPYDALVIDGGGLVTASWASHKDLYGAANRIRAGLYVFVTCLASLARLVKADARVVVCWDGLDNRAFRRGRHPWYKHGRGTIINRQECRIIIEELDALLKAIGVAQINIEKTEADDYVATVAREFEADGERVLIFSDDKDYLQLITENINLMRRSIAGVILSPNQCDLMGIEYGETYLAMKSIMGDNGDNIRGLIGIGEVKARAAVKAIPDLIQQIKSGGGVDWSPLDSVTRKAILKAGRNLISPQNPSPKNLGEINAVPESLGLSVRCQPIEFEDDDVFAFVEHEIEWTYDMVEMNTTMYYGDTLVFPDVNLEVIPKSLRKLDLQGEDDLVSSLYSLAKMRAPNTVVPPRSSTSRVGAAMDDVPEGAF